MRALLAAAVAALATTVLAPAAEATCMTREDKVTGIRQTWCSAPGGPVTTTICYRDVQPCVSYTSGEGPGGGD